MSRSVSGSSTAEKALNERIDIAEQRLRQWHDEVKSWDWPRSKFEKAEVSRISQDERPASEETDYWGSLPATVVLEREKRVGEIRDGVETLDMETLKDCVRGAHPRTSPGSSIKHIDDFTAAITEKIMLALPYVTKLEALLDVWIIRTAVLRQVPGYHLLLADARDSLTNGKRTFHNGKHSKQDVRSNAESAGNSPSLAVLDIQSFASARTQVQQKISAVGQILDFMLDSLAGSREDRLPEHWIDEMEKLEAEYEEWVTITTQRLEEQQIVLQQRNSSLPTVQEDGPKNAVESSPDLAKSGPQSIDDQLTARISKILTKIPAPIRLAKSPQVDRSSDYDLLSTPKSTTSAQADPTTPQMTLAPARLDTNKPRNNDSDIKLYHLHQPGKSVPIKLYVRLVGEGGERVMVRIGGGWADLGEWLKEYASHHGRRAVSEGKFEIKGIPAAQSAAYSATKSAISSGRNTPTSRPTSPEFVASSATSAPSSRRVSGAALRTPEPSSRYFDVTTPDSARSNGSGINSPAGSLGLAGPKGKDVEISPKKKAWVEGMLNQAKQVNSTENKKAGPGELGDLGKVKGTRRMFFRSKK
jgi:hypothetical protein